MEVSHILNPLNDDQRNAVASPANNLLVLAGAGRLHADDYTKAHIRYVTGLEPRKDQIQIAVK